jgi:hypothetical protein
MIPAVHILELTKDYSNRFQEEQHLLSDILQFGTDG